MPCFSVREVEGRVAEVALALHGGDHARAHWLEHELQRDALIAIADGHPHWRVIAEKALHTRDLMDWPGG